MSKYLEFASIRQGKEESGGGLYIKVEQDVTLKSGETVYIDTPQAKIEKLVELGFIKEDEAETRLEKIPDYIKYKLTKKNQ